MTTEQQQEQRLSRLHTKQVRWAYLLAEHYGDELMYVTGLGWFAWDGTRWREDSDGATAKRALYESLRRGRAQPNVPPDRLREIISMETASSINGILSLAQAIAPIHCTVDLLDADPNLLNVANGTLDLLTLQLRPHSPADRITKITRAAYRPEARSKTWERFLPSSLPDAEVREFLARYCGYALSGRVTEHVAVILIGEGRNGKGVFYGAVTYALGDYAGIGEPELFLTRRGAHPTGEMDLRGKRVIVVSETGQGASLAAATFKRLVGGDRIKARKMRQDFVEFDPSHSPFLVTNHLPTVRGDDPALWERMRVVPFEVVIPAPERDKHLGQRLELDADALLTWMVAGRADYHDRGDDLDPPDAVVNATDEYRSSQDAVTRFLEEEADKVRGAKTLLSVMFTRWRTWSDRNELPSLGKKEFRKALENREITVKLNASDKQNYVYGYDMPSQKFTVNLDRG